MAGRGEHMTSERKTSAVERQRQVLELVKAGHDFRTIANQLGYSGPSGAHKAFKSAMQATIQPAANEMRMVQLERLNQLWKTIYPRMVKGELQAIDRGVKLLGEIAELMGLNAPKEVKVQHEMAAMANRVATDLGLNPADVLAEAERILVASGQVD